MRSELGFTRDTRNLGSLCIQAGTRSRWSHVFQVYTGTTEEFNDILSAVVSRLRDEGRHGASAAVTLMCWNRLATIMPWPDGLMRVYWESVWKVDPITGKNGVRGPVDLRNVIEWQKADAHHRELDLREFDSVTPPARSIDRWCCAVPDIRYAPIRQLIGNLRHALRGIGISVPSPDRWQCAEAIARANAEHAAAHWGLGDLLFDHYTPAGRTGGVMERLGPFVVMSAT